MSPMPGKGPLLVKAHIPDGELYPTEIKRLSRKSLRNYPYEKEFWSDEHNTVVKIKKATESVINFADVTHVELHDATKPPQSSLFEIQLVTVHDFGKQKRGMPCFPTEYISYVPDDDSILRWRIDDFQEGMDEAAIKHATFSTLVEGGDRERLILYGRLVFNAGETVPGIR